jgi:hypothetical protein
MMQWPGLALLFLRTFLRTTRAQRQAAAFVGRACGQGDDHVSATNHCCEEFAKQAGCYQQPVGGGMYGRSAVPVAQFEQSKDGTWNVNGCCGGGCYVVTGMKFCPYCGSKLSLPSQESPSE